MAVELSSLLEEYDVSTFINTSTRRKNVVESVDIVLPDDFSNGDYERVIDQVCEDGGYATVSNLEKAGVLLEDGAKTVARKGTSIVQSLLGGEDSRGLKKDFQDVGTGIFLLGASALTAAEDYSGDIIHHYDEQAGTLDEVGRISQHQESGERLLRVSTKEGTNYLDKELVENIAEQVEKQHY